MIVIFVVAMLKGLMKDKNKILYYPNVFSAIRHGSKIVLLLPFSIFDLSSTSSEALIQPKKSIVLEPDSN